MPLFLQQTKAEYKPVRTQFRLAILLSFLFFVCIGNGTAQLTQVTSENGITVQFTLPEPTLSEVIRDRVRYQEVHYDDCRFTDVPGNPKVPVTRLMLGIPATAEIEAIDVSASPAETRTGVRLVPVPIFDVREGNSQHAATQYWTENGSAYQSNAGNASYPGFPLARVVREGYIRSQRVIALALYPVQYLPRTRQLRLYSHLTVNIRFSSSSSQSSVFGNQLGRGSVGRSSSLTGSPLESEAFERALSHQLLNAEQARNFRVPRPLMPAAPALVPDETSNSIRYKLFVEETGVYAVTAGALQQEWGIELVGADPTQLRLTHENRNIPIYISGAGDGRFDPEDAIFFLGHKSKNRYSRWNIYWLTLDSRRRISARVPQVTVSPTDPTATQVPTFRSQLTFEENYLTNNLEFVHTNTVSPGNKHGWFEALDFWYWDGIKNGSDVGEMRLAFPLYDVAKSFDPLHISVDLQGGTPVSHEILVAINGVRIEFAQWEQQDTLTVQRTLRAWDTLKDSRNGEQNVLSLARVDDNVDEDTTRYPYHVYLNRFSVEYTRLFRAVADELWFTSPTPDATSQTKPAGGRKLQYEIKAFDDPGVHIFETDGNVLTARMQGVNVETDIENPNSYNALFQMLDTRDAEFIAVSDTALRQPERIEIIAPTDLATANHGVDYLIVAHSKFLSAAERLAAWRATPGGGGYRTRVVTTDEIYNTFGGGAVSSKAIKAFLTHAYQTWAPPALSYVVLFGDGTFDFRGVDTEIHLEPPELDGYIPTHYIRTDSFGRTAADHWYATVSGHDAFTDFYIGRLSVETVSQSETVVDKILAYEQSPPSGDWRRKIISVADDEVSNSGDFIFKKSLNEIAKDHTRLGYETIEVFLEDVIDEVEARPADYSNILPRYVARERIIKALEEGAVLAQYAGHGGRTVWTHESIFDNADVDEVEETAKIPFMLVLSCYNGYFDKPGEPSMAEKLLRKERGGIIGMLSATRLTYGSGNDALNRIIFDMLFKRNIRQLGPLSFDSKVELLMTEGTGQIDVMMEYTLFGDPALQLAIAEGEILPNIETKTVAPGDTLRVAPGYVQTATYDALGRVKRFTRNTTFSGTLTVKALFPGKTVVAQGISGPVNYYTGDVILTKTLSVSNGAYPAVTFTVPQNISSGDAHVEYYAQSPTTIAVGGDGFTVNIPKILDVQPELVGEDKFRISVQVSDEKEQVASALLSWRNPITRQWEYVSLIQAPPPLAADGWWTVPEPLDAPVDGSVIRYNIQVTDADGNTVESQVLRYYPYVYPNLSVVEVARTAVIRYGYNTETQQWALSADIQVEGDAVQTPVEVAFFYGNPDVDDDTITDDSANLLGTARIQPGDWRQRTPLVNSESPREEKEVYEPDPLNTLPIATATLPLTANFPFATGQQENVDRRGLPFGIHDIFVYVDPNFGEADGAGKVLENEEDDNIAYRQISVDMGVIGGTASNQIASLDRNCVVTVPPGVLQNSTVLQVATLSAIDGLLTPERGAQRNTLTASESHSTKHAPLPGNAYGYTLAISHQQSGAAENTFNATGELPTVSDGFQQPTAISLTSPVAIDFSFDLGVLGTQLAKELLGSAEEVTDVSDTAATIGTAVESRAREIGVYQWSPTLGNWIRLPSQLLTDAAGTLQRRTHATDIGAENIGGGELRDIRLHPDGAPTGKYVLLFTGPQTYRLLRAPFTEGTRTLGELEVVAPREQLASFSTDLPNFRHGFDVNVEIDPEQPFRFGDVWTFNITALEQPLDTDPDISSQQELQWYASGFGDVNRGTGIVSAIEIPPDTTMPEDRWIIFFSRHRISG